MSSWILSIVGIVCLGVIVDIFIPEGQTNKYIKNIFSLLIVFVIISPLPKLLNNDLSFSNIINNVNTEIDLNFISIVNNQKINSIKNLILSALKKENISVNDIDLSCNYLQEEFEIMSIFVDISNIFGSTDFIFSSIKSLTFNSYNPSLPAAKANCGNLPAFID